MCVGSRLTLKDTESRDKMLLAGFVKVRNRYTFRIRSAAKSQFVVRVHWASPFMSNKFISAMLYKHVSIVSMDKERALSDGFDGLATGVRQIVLQGKMGDVPHTSSVVCPYTGVTHTILLTITSRKPLCLLATERVAFAVSAMYRIAVTTRCTVTQLKVVRRRNSKADATAGVYCRRRTSSRGSHST